MTKVVACVADSGDFVTRPAATQTNSSRHHHHHHHCQNKRIDGQLLVAKKDVYRVFSIGQVAVASAAHSICARKRCDMMMLYTRAS